MKLLVGLGNPGAKYARHRHNVGFMALDAIIEHHNFGPVRRRFHSEAAEGRIDQEQVLAIKPQTFMNESGRAVSEAARFYKIGVSDIIVLHDEIDLDAGKVRVKRGGGLAGHNGLKSIAAHLGPDFTRVRIGIGHPGDKDRVHRHVLGDFAKADAAWLDPLLDDMAGNAAKLVAGDHANFMNALAGTSRKQPMPVAPDSSAPGKVQSTPRHKGGAEARTGTRGGASEKPRPPSQQDLARGAARAEAKREGKPNTSRSGQTPGAEPKNALQMQDAEAAHGPFAALRRLLRGGREPGQS